ncbi:hypothetical protein D3C80_1106350 [compost metagenome]
MFAQQAHQFARIAQPPPGAAVGCVRRVEDERAHAGALGIDQQHALQGMAMDRQLAHGDALSVHRGAKRVMRIVQHLTHPTVGSLIGVAGEMPGIARLGRLGAHAGAVDQGMGVQPPPPDRGIDQLGFQVGMIAATDIQVPDHRLDVGRVQCLG